jgi:hypothetical protein
VKETSNRGLQLTTAQEEVLNLINSWLGSNNFPKADLKTAEDIWLQYIANSSNNKSNYNVRIWAAAVIYILGRERGYSWLSQSKLAESFTISTGSISLRWQEIIKVLKADKSDQPQKEPGINSILNPKTVEVFRKLMNFTQTSEKWKGYVGETFYQFVGFEVQPLPIDLILELLIFITCDRVLPDGKKIVDYFIQHTTELNQEELVFLNRMKASRFSLFEVLAINEYFLDLKDLFRREKIKIEVNKLKGVEKGNIIMGRVIPVQKGENGFWRYGSNVIIFEQSDLEELETMAKRWFWEYSVANKGWATNEDFIRENSFRFWRWLIENTPSFYTRGT